MATQTLDSIIRAGITRGDKGATGSKGDKGAQLQSATYTSANDTVTFTNSDSSTIEFNGVKGEKGAQGIPGTAAAKGDKGDTGALGYGGPKITNIQVANSNYSVTGDVAVSTSGGYVVISGSGFLTGCNVVVGNIPATSVTYVNSNTVHAQVGGQTAGSYHAYVVNSDGGTAIRLNAVTFGQSPGWITDATLPTFLYSQAIYVYLNAVSDSVVTYSVAAGSSLPSGLTLAANGLLSGTASGITANTTFNFTVVATDVENQTSSRSFSMTVSLGQFAQVSNLIDKMQATTVAGILYNNGFHGSGVAATSDGYRIAVGNAYESKNNSTIGAYGGSVTIWQQTTPGANNWSAFQKILSPVANAMFGSAIAMSANGDALFIGGSRQERLFSYSLANNEYKLANTYYPGFTVGSNYANTLALSADGKILVVGGPNANTTNGVTHIINATNPASPTVIVQAYGATSEYSGAGVAIAGLDNANGYLIASMGRGQANTVRLWKGNTTSGFTASNNAVGALASCSNSVAVAPDMSFIVLGGFDEKVRIFDNTATNLLYTLTAFDNVGGDSFGESVSIAKYGANNYLLVAAKDKDDPVVGANTGSVYVYTGSNATNWSYVTQIMPAESANSALGWQFPGIMCSNSSRPTIITGAYRQMSGQQNGVVYFTTSTNTFSSFTTFRTSNIPIVATPISSAVISSDGNYIALGMANDSSASTASMHGSIALYEKSGNTYINTARLYGDANQVDARAATAVVTSSIRHGQNMAISGNGMWIAVGNPQRDANSILLKTGAVLVHSRNVVSGTWKTGSILFANTTNASYANSQIGWSVAITSNAALIVSGAPYLSIANGGGGFIWGLQQTPVWTGVVANTGVVHANTQLGDGMGWSIAVGGSAAGVGYAVVAAGAPLATSRTGSANTQEGYVGVYRVSWSNAVSYITQIRASDIAAGDQFGYSVAISPDGSTLAVGAPGRDDTHTGAGAVYVFTNNGADEFVQSAKFQAADPAPNDRFGSFVSMSGNSTIYVGVASADVHSRTDSGAAYKFSKSGGTWAQTAKFISNNAAFAHDSAGFGTTVSSTSDDGSILILAPLDKASATGSAYLFTQTL